MTMHVEGERGGHYSPVTPGPPRDIRGLASWGASDCGRRLVPLLSLIGGPSR